MKRKKSYSMAEDGAMENGCGLKPALIHIKKYGRKLALAVFVAAAGCSYSCGMAGQGELLPGTEVKTQEIEDLPETLSGQEVLPVPDIVSIKETSGVSKDVPVSEAGTAASCFVHVCGQVETPGVYELKEGQRVFEAVQMAGGFAEQAARDYLNLAEPVWDGMRLEVPAQDQVPDTDWAAQAGSRTGAGQGGSQAGTGQAVGSRQGTGTASSAGKVNLNTAVKEELMTLRGIGEARAEDIIRYREERGGFARIEDIMEISGIKNAAFEKIKDDITV